MELVHARERTLLLSEDGRIHAPFSLYLNMEFDSPHTFASVAVGLNLLDLFIRAFSVNLEQRALDGQCLTEPEKHALRQMAYRPIADIERMSQAMVRRFAKTTSDLAPPDREGAVQPNTAQRRLRQIAAFLEWYERVIIAPGMPIGSPTKDALRRSYESCCEWLKTAIGGTKSSHPHSIRSAPRDTFLAIYRKVYLEPEAVFRAPSGKPSVTMLRDRAIVLLAAEGVRPGAIGNLQLADFRWNGDSAGGYLRIKDNLAKRGTRITAATPTQKGIRSKQPYNSEITIKLWPTTCAAIQQYAEGARQTAIGKTLKNPSKGFLFVTDNGKPIASRTTLAAVFKRAEHSLGLLGLLNRAPTDPYLNGDAYDLVAYLMRHSAASLFYEVNADRPDATSLMKDRFGWTAKSNMPALYARRSISDRAGVDLLAFLDSLRTDRETKEEA
jgi:integrase